MRVDRMRTIVVFIAIIIVLAFFGFYVQIDTRHFRGMLSRRESFESQEVSRMKAELGALRQLQQDLNNASFETNNALTLERKNAQRLQKKVEFLIAQNKSFLDKMNLARADKQSIERVKDEMSAHLEDLTAKSAGLQKEVDLLRKNFDVALQVKSRLDLVREAIESLNVQKGRENILKIQLDALTREIEDTNQYLVEMRDSRISPKLVFPGSPEPGSPARDKKGRINLGTEIEYLGQINDLNARINILTNENSVLKEKYLMAQEVTEQHKKALDAATQKIFSLETRLIETESAYSQSNVKYKDLERNVASLRERYVANELEKEGLKIKLNQLASELNDVRGKFLALLGKITDIFQSPGDISSSARYNLTSVIGVELFSNSTDVKK